MQRRPFMLLLYTIETFCQVALNESRDFAPAGATFFSLVGKEGKSTPRGKGTLSTGSPSPLEPPTLRNDQRGAEAPRLDFPAEAARPFGRRRRTRRSAALCVAMPEWASQFFARRPNGRALAPGGIQRWAPQGPLWSEGRGAGEGAFELPPLLPALLLTFAAAGKSKSPPQGRNTCSRRSRRSETPLLSNIFADLSSGRAKKLNLQKTQINHLEYIQEANKWFLYFHSV